MVAEIRAVLANGDVPELLDSVYNGLDNLSTRSETPSRPGTSLSETAIDQLNGRSRSPSSVTDGRSEPGDVGDIDDLEESAIKSRMQRAVSITFCWPS
jgi:hypothetical protein